LLGEFEGKETKETCRILMPNELGNAERLTLGLGLYNEIDDRSFIMLSIL